MSHRPFDTARSRWAVYFYMVNSMEVLDELVWQVRRGELTRMLRRMLGITLPVPIEFVAIDGHEQWSASLDWSGWIRQAWQALGQHILTTKPKV